MNTPDQTTPERGPSKRQKKRWRTAALGQNPHGQPQHRHAGRPPRRPEPPDPKIDQRQTTAYELHVAGRSKRAIAEALGVSLETVGVDIRMEAERRAIDRARDRDALIQTSVSRYESAISAARTAIDACLRTAFEETTEGEGPVRRIVRKVKDPKALALMALHQDSLVKAQKALDRVLGLATPLPAGAGAAAPPVSTESAVLVLMDGLPSEQRVEQWRRLLGEAKSLGVAPAQVALPK